MDAGVVAGHLLTPAQPTVSPEKRPENGTVDKRAVESALTDSQVRTEDRRPFFEPGAAVVQLLRRSVEAFAKIVSQTGDVVAAAAQTGFTSVGQGREPPPEEASPTQTTAGKIDVYG